MSHHERGDVVPFDALGEALQYVNFGVARLVELGIPDPTGADLFHKAVIASVPLWEDTLSKASWSVNDGRASLLEAALRFDEWRRLEISNCREMLQNYVSAFENLRHLAVRWEPIDARVSALQMLEVVSLKQCTLDLSTTASLSELPHLRELHIIELDLSDEHVEVIAQCSTLERLTMPYVRGMLTDVALSHIARGPLAASLTSLDLSGWVRITDAGMLPLIEMPKLKHLVLYRCIELTDVAAERVTAMQSLTKLDMGGCKKLTDDGLEKIAFGLLQLRELKLYRCNGLTDFGIWHIVDAQSRHYGRLEVLALGGCTKLTDAAVEKIHRLPRLKSLDLYGCRFTPNAFRELHLAEQLHTLSLSYCVDLKMQSVVEELGRCPSITDLDLSGVKTPGDMVAPLVELPALKKLNFAYQGARGVNDESLEVLARSSSLEVMDICGCVDITVSGLARLKGSSSLRHLHVGHLPGVMREELTAMELQLEKCRVHS